MSRPRACLRRRRPGGVLAWGAQEQSEPMMVRGQRYLLTAMLGLALAASGAQAFAFDKPAMDAAVGHIQREWERIKYQGTNVRVQRQQIGALAHEAGAVSARYPGRAEPLIWE